VDTADDEEDTLAHRSSLVLAAVPFLEPAGLIGLCANGLTTSKIDDFLSELTDYVNQY